MHSQSLLPAAADAVFAALAFFSAPLLAAETAADIPKDTYASDPLTVTERSGIASEENVSPNDGRMSVPASGDEGVIPDAGDRADRTANTETEKQNLDEDVHHGPKGSEKDEAAAVLKESKKDFKVTHKDLADCMKSWGPQTQMTKEEWAASCRTTLEYFPDAQ